MFFNLIIFFTIDQCLILLILNQTRQRLVKLLFHLLKNFSLFPTFSFHQKFLLNSLMAKLLGLVTNQLIN